MIGKKIEDKVTSAASQSSNPEADSETDAKSIEIPCERSV